MTMIKSMLKKDVIAHFGSPSKVAEAMNMSEAGVSLWPDLVPPASAMELEELTSGALKVNPSIYIKDARKKRREARRRARERAKTKVAVNHA